MLRFLCEDIEFQAAAAAAKKLFFSSFRLLLIPFVRLAKVAKPKAENWPFLRVSSFAKAGRWVGRSFSSSFDYEGTNIKPHFRPIFLYF